MNRLIVLALGLVAISTPCFAPTPATQRATNNYYYPGSGYSQPESWYPQNYPSNGRVSGGYYIITGLQNPSGASNSPNNNNGSPGRSFVIPITFPSATTYPGQNSPIYYYPTRKKTTFPPNSVGGNQGNYPGRPSFGENNSNPTVPQPVLSKNPSTSGPTGTNNQNYPNKFNPGSSYPGRSNNPVQPRPNFGVPSNACGKSCISIEQRIKRNICSLWRRELANPYHQWTGGTKISLPLDGVHFDE